MFQVGDVVKLVHNRAGYDPRDLGQIVRVKKVYQYERRSPHFEYEGGVGRNWLHCAYMDDAEYAGGPW